MIELKISTATAITTVHVYAPGADMKLEFYECLFCGQNLVQPPRKFCSLTCRVSYCRKDLKSVTVPVTPLYCRVDKTTA